jgi:hypothetical protein
MIVLPSNIHSLEMTISRGLHNNTDYSKSRCPKQGIPSPPSIGRGRGNQGSKETPCLESGDDVGR